MFFTGWGGEIDLCDEAIKIKCNEERICIMGWRTIQIEWNNRIDNMDEFDMSRSCKIAEYDLEALSQFWIKKKR